MTSIIHHAWTTILNRQTPLVKLCDVQALATDLTTYTFTGVNLGDIGSVGSITGDAYGVNPHCRSDGRKMIVIVVHAEDAAITFTITSCSIGGVAGTERVDRGGGANAINTGIYSWDTDALQNITNTDVVVVFSEAITSCAIGVLSVQNIGLAQFIAGDSATSTAAINTNATRSFTNDDTFAVAIMGTTCLTPTETVAFDINDSGVLARPMLLYEGNNGEFAYAAAWSYSAQWCGAVTTTIYQTRADWSGATGGDGALAVFM